jgi:alkanesulfonate monooxygenase SsuD/methylene tetrahydromethanopterin reductase-like flavin-dependent oxidoreductase (luciferase family)
MTMLMLRFDMRLPSIAPAPRESAYAAALDMASWADENGFASIVLSEHHGVDDGYLPTPLILAAAILGRTKKVSVSVSALLATLYDPIRLAEELAVIDAMAPGRINLVAGLGYRDDEYAMFGVDKSKRGALLEENLRVLLDAWTGEPFDYRGTRMRVTPAPVTKPHPLVFVGGGGEVAAKRAARLGLPFFPMVHNPALKDAYEAECARLGSKPFMLMPDSPCYVHVAKDVEAGWESVGPHMLYDASTYSSWQPPGQHSAVHVNATTIEGLRESGVYRVLTPDEAVGLAKETGTLMFHPMVGGLDPAMGWESLRLFETEVKPRL